MASLADILTATKNIVTALNQLGQTYLSVEGQNLMSDVDSTVLVKSGQGRIARVSVVTAGSSTGSIYDANSATATTDKVWTIPTTIGITEINLPVNNGIVVAPGSGQVVAISYS